MRIDRCRNFIEVLRHRAAETPDRPAFTFLGDGENDEITWTYAMLERRARAVAAMLQGRVAPGGRVLLCYPPCLEFLAGFFGCLFAGVVAVPVYPPRPNRSINRLHGIVASARPALVLTTAELAAQVPGAFAEAPWLLELPWIGSDQVPSESAGGCASRPWTAMRWPSSSTPRDRRRPHAV